MLFETGGADSSLGHSDTYQHVRVPEPGLRGQIRRVRILGVKDDILTGKIEE